MFAARGAPERKNKKESSETAVVTIREHFISISQGSDQSKKNQKKEKKDENTYALESAHQHTHTQVDTDSVGSCLVFNQGQLNKTYPRLIIIITTVV